MPSPSSSATFRSLRPAWGNWFVGHATGLAVCALALIVFGLGLRSILFHGGDVPSDIGWLERLVETAAGHRPHFFSGVFFSHGIEQALTSLNGQWDPALVLIAFA